MHRMFVALLLLALAGCNGQGVTIREPRGPIEQTAVDACLNYEPTIRVLTAYRTANRLTRDEVDQVNKSRPVFLALCTAPGAGVAEMPANALVHQALQSELTGLNAIISRHIGAR